MSSKPPQSPSRDVEKGEFCRACGQFATGVSIAAVLDGAGAAHGMTVSSFTSVSLDPPLVLICIGHQASAYEHFRAAPHFGISILRDDQRALSERFAERGRDRFAEVPWFRGRTGVPLVEDALGYLECAVERIDRAGDHDIFIGRVLGTELRGGSPLIYYGSRYRGLAQP